MKSDYAVIKSQNNKFLVAPIIVYFYFISITSNIISFIVSILVISIISIIFISIVSIISIIGIISTIINITIYYIGILLLFFIIVTLTLILVIVFVYSICHLRPFFLRISFYSV